MKKGMFFIISSDEKLREFNSILAKRGHKQGRILESAIDDYILKGGEPGWL